MLVSGSNKHYSTPFTDEKEIEQVVVDYAEYLFAEKLPDNGTSYNKSNHHENPPIPSIHPHC